MKTEVIPVIKGVNGAISKSVKIPEQQNRTAHEGGANSRTGHCTYTAEGTSVKVLNVYHGKTKLDVPRAINHNHRIAASPCIRYEHGLFQVTK